ncbi:MAG: septal ring lytic transglycosylase RlpA family protein [Hyphomicrobium sp.]|nr:septal ring lytic transglycosylase RlpA family protein [Hyphomicrobium sp.]
MRLLIAAVVAAFAFSQAPVAEAARWECMGPAASCASAKPVKAAKQHYKSAKKAGAYKKAAYKTGKSKKYASKKVSKKVYSGGGAFSGIASYYWQPQRVASGGWFNPNAMTAAHKTLPFGTVVRVTNRNNGRSVTVRINDRGPYIKGRVIDLSKAAAKEIGMTGSGIAPVSVSVIGRG